MRTANICPTCATYTNAKCVIYDGPYLSTLDINTSDPVDESLKKLEIWATTIDNLASGDAVLTKDITASVNVGGISIGQVFPVGTTFTTLFENLISPTLLPSILSTQSLSVSNIPSTTMEVGTSYNRQINWNFSQGSIQSKNGTPNVPLVGPSSLVSFTGNGVNASGLISTQIILGANTWTVEVNYSAGTVPYYDSVGNAASNLDSYRTAGSITQNTSTITGRYRYWYVTGSLGSTPSTSASIRALPLGGFATNTSFDISIPANTKEVAFYVPSSVSLVSVVFVQSSNANVTSTFVPTDISVQDGGSGNVPYKKYTAIIGGTGYPSVATYRVTIN